MAIGTFPSNSFPTYTFPAYTWPLAMTVVPFDFAEHYDLTLIMNTTLNFTQVLNTTLAFTGIVNRTLDFTYEELDEL
jgi:hypothetical protein